MPVRLQAWASAGVSVLLDPCAFTLTIMPKRVIFAQDESWPRARETCMRHQPSQPAIETDLHAKEGIR